MLLLVLPVLAATVWAPICTASTDPTVWLVFEGPPREGPSELGCTDIMFGAVPCASMVGLATIRSTEGKPTLRYAISGDDAQLLGFLDRDLGGVSMEVPRPPASVVPPPPPSPDQLVLRYLDQRGRASAPSLGVTLHVWTCPEAPTIAPDGPGLVVRNHVGRVVIR